MGNCCKVGSIALPLTGKKGRRAGQKKPSFFPVCVSLPAPGMPPEKVAPAVPEVSAVPFRAGVQCSSLEEWGAPAVVPREKPVPAGGGVGSWALPVAEVVETEQGELSSFGCYKGDRAMGKKE